MDWTSRAATGSDPDTLLGRVLAAGGRADLAFAFVHAPAAERLRDLPGRLAEGLGGTHVLGCTAGGVIGGGREWEGAPALSVMAGTLPGGQVHGFHLAQDDLPDPDAPPAAWHEAVGVVPQDARGFVLLADPFSLDAPALLAGLDFAFPGVVKVGGLASGARRPGEAALFHGDRSFDGGAVGVVLMGDVKLSPAVAQGCRALGPPLRITACKGNLLQELDGSPVLQALSGVLSGASARDRALAQRALFVGFAMDPFQDEPEGAWLIRNILGADPETRGLYIGEHLRIGRSVRFHVRDRVTSAEDLERTLSTVSGESPRGALLFSCMGRGAHLYGEADHDSRVFGRHFGDVPLGGFFCAGEIGPVGRTTHLHGYTSSFGLISAGGDAGQ